MNKVTKNYEGQGALCRSLSEESDLLKRKLDETVTVCQNLLLKLSDCKLSDDSEQLNAIKTDRQINEQKSSVEVRNASRKT